MIETEGHLKLKNNIKTIFENAKFDKVDTEINIDIDGDGKTEFSIDVCAIYKDTMFVIQCKDRNDLSEIKKELTATCSYMNEVLKMNGKILDFAKNITNAELNHVTDIKCCYAFTEKLSNPDTETFVKQAGFLFWDNKAVKYYKRITDILKDLSRNEILKEFGLFFGKKTTWEENAVEIKQGNNTMYLLGMHPGLLLKIAYVYRRNSEKSSSYQRLINKERLTNISRFFTSSNDLLLANPVIIVFDQDPDVQKRISYIKEDKSLRFPISFCSAWIIDGQHRIYGFKDHPKYKNWDGDEEPNDLKIPVVAFMKLGEVSQNQTFVNINYYQKKIDPVLFNDLATVIQDLKQELTWPSLLVSEMNKDGPWKNMIKISELDSGKPITISGFAKLILLHTLLGYNKKSGDYSGPLCNIAKFNKYRPFSDPTNQEAFQKHLVILNRFFSVVKKKVKNNSPEKDKWLNYKEYGLTKFTCVNALMLVLNALLQKDPELKMDLEKYLNAIDVVDFRNEKLLKYGRGYPAIPKIANKIIRAMNLKYKAKLKLVGK